MSNCRSSSCLVRLQAFLLALLVIVAIGCSQTLAAGVDEFSIVVLPDTQNYSQSRPDIEKAQAQWIADNATALQIKMVLQAGDLVNKGATDQKQWQNVKSALSIIDNAGIPLFIAMGNHDYDDQAKTRATTAFNTYFGLDRYKNQPWFGGAYEANKAENAYGLVNAGGRQYLVLVLEYGPRKAVIDWANTIIAEHPKSDVIIITHNNLYNDDTLSGPNAQWNPHLAGIGTDAFDGQEMWQGLTSQHQNMVLVQNGHILGDGLGRRTDIGVNGNMVHQILANYQMLPNGGNGYLRILRFRPDAAVIEVKTYSPYLNTYLTDPQNEFTLPYTTADKVWQSAKVQGRVVDAVSKLGMPGTLITIQKNGMPYSNLATDTDGHFTVQLPLGSYELNINDDRHNPEIISVAVDVPNKQYDLDIQLSPITLFAGKGRVMSGALAEASGSDIMLQNQKLSMVIAVDFVDSQIPDTSKGKPVDFAAAGITDGIDWMNMPYLSPTQPQGTYAWRNFNVLTTDVRVVENSTTRVVVEAVGRYILIPNILVNTTFTLESEKEWVYAVTRVTNNGTLPLTLWAGDMIDNDDGKQFSYVPGKGEITSGTVTLHPLDKSWIAQYGDAPQVFAIMYDGSFRDCAAYGANLWIMSQKEITIPAGGHYDINRYLVVASTTGRPSKIDPILELYNKIQAGLH